MAEKEGRIAPQVGFVLWYRGHLFKRKRFNGVAAFSVRLTKQETRHGQAKVSGFRPPSQPGKTFQLGGGSLRPIVGVRLRPERTAPNQVRTCTSHQRGTTRLSEACNSHQHSAVLRAERIKAKHRCRADFLQLPADDALCQVLR